MTPPQDRSGPGPALDPRGEGAACLLFAATAGLGAGLHVLSHVLASTLAAGLGWHFLLAALPAGWAYLQFRTYRTAWELKRQEDALAARVGAESLFAGVSGADPAGRLGHARGALALAGDLALLVLGAVLAFHFFPAEKAPAVHPAAGSAICALVALIAYVGGRYVAALGAAPAWRPVRVCGTWATAGGIFAFGAVIAFAVAHAGWPQFLSVLDRAVPFWFVLLAAEKAAALLGRAYGLKAGEVEPGKSTVVELVGAPARVGRSFGDALAYNFGVRLTWSAVQGFGRRIAAPFALLAAGVFLLLSCFSWIETGNVGLLERFGRQVPGVLEPGLRLTAPWPVDRVRIEAAGRIREVGIGAGHSADIHEHGGTVLWTEAHGEESLFLTPAWGDTGDAMGLLAVSASVRFSVDDGAAYAYRARAPERIMASQFRRALIRLAAGTDPRRFFGPDRPELVDNLKQTLAAAAVRYGLAVHSVTIEHAHMPVEVGPAFEEVARARAAQAAAVAGAEAEAIRKKEVLTYEARTTEHRARAETAAILAEGTVRAQLVGALSPYWKAIGALLETRFRMEALRQTGPARSKLVIPANREGVTVFEVTEGARFPFESAGVED